MTKTTTLFILLASLWLTACSDPNYHPENYQAFDSMDEMVFEIVESIRESNETRLLTILENEALLFDLLNSAKGDDAQKTKAYLATEAGKRSLSVEQLSKKQRLNAFFSTGLPTQITINKSAFRLVGFEFQKKTPFSEGSPAELQDYRIMLNNGDDNTYGYDIQVVLWNGQYHLIEAAGFLNKL